MAYPTSDRANRRPFNPQRQQLTTLQNGVLIMKLIKTLTLAALVAAAPLSALAGEHYSFVEDQGALFSPDCFNIQETGAICQVFMVPTVINVDTTTKVSLEEVLQLNPGLEHFIGIDGKMRQHVFFRVG